MSSYIRPLIALTVALALAACAAATSPPLPSGPRPAFGAWGVDLTSMDASVRPGDDFFLYVSGKWLAGAAIPPDRTSTGSFQDLQILSEQRMKAIVAGIEKAKPKQLDAEGRQLRDLYDAFMDTKAIDKAGLKPAPSTDTAASLYSSSPGTGRPRTEASASARRQASITCADEACRSSSRSSRAARVTHSGPSDSRFSHNNSYHAGDSLPAP